jgi:murein DD-endopeptidase MepM/ murein hydrolase activator NlpD
MKLVSRQGWRAEVRDTLRIVSLDWAAQHPNEVRYRWHNGADWVSASGETEGVPLVASLPAVVRYADARGGVGMFAGYGSAVVLEYAPNVLSLYAHCRDVLVPVGANVEAGTHVATVGRTSRPGRFVGRAHLHWELAFSWPLRAADTRKRYDVLASLEAAGWFLQRDATLGRAPREHAIRSGTVRAHPAPYPPSETGGIVDLLLVGAAVRALNDGGAP